MKRIMSFLVFFATFCLLINDVSAEERESFAALIVKSGVVFDTGGVLLKKGTLNFEPAITYSHVSTNKLDVTGFSVLPALVVGLIQVEKINRDIFIPSATFKYGITNNLEVDLRIPYFMRKDEYITGTGASKKSTSADENGVGDIESSILYHAFSEKGMIPDIITSLKIKSDTGKDPYDLDTKTVNGINIPKELPLGSGHWAIEPSISFLKTEDPAIIFANIGYFWHIKRHISGQGEVDPSDSINYSIGFAYALNEKIVLSTAFDQKFFTKAEIDGAKQIESDITVASMLFGTSYSFSDKSSVSLSVSIGLTPESPDVQVGLKMPISIL